jgi:hypothetical protein
MGISPFRSNRIALDPIARVVSLADEDIVFISRTGPGPCKAFRVARGCNGYFDAVAGKRPGQGLADIAEADDCAAHRVSPIVC